jgi:Concanavalin A-like lectin/glucanases superfamily
LDKKVHLYLNGMLDSIIVTEGASVPNNAPLFVGNTPYYVEECDIQGFIDELRFYQRTLSENEIEAEASPALGNVHPDYVILGCLDCPALEASKSCVEGYHLCTTVELHTAAYQVAKISGWVSFV